MHQEPREPWTIGEAVGITWVLLSRHSVVLRGKTWNQVTFVIHLVFCIRPRYLNSATSSRPSHIRLGRSSHIIHLSLQSNPIKLSTLHTRSHNGEDSAAENQKLLIHGRGVLIKLWILHIHTYNGNCFSFLSDVHSAAEH